MTEKEKKTIRICIDQLKEIKESFNNSEGYLFETNWDESEQIIYVGGNNTGILSFTLKLLELLVKEYEGAHFELDEHSGLPEGSIAITVIKKD